MSASDGETSVEAADMPGPLARPRGPGSALAVEATGLVKHFGATRAVDGLDLRVPAGTVYGVLGPNGAGKTTAIRVLATLLRPDAGSARVLGLDVVDDADAVRGRVSLTGQFASVDEDLTGLENLVLLARLLGFTRADARARARVLLEAFGLGDAAGRQVKAYSGGMRRRLDFAASIVVTPDLIFLDEPTTGLDPRSRNQVWDIVRTLVAEGTTVLLTTQYLDEADQLAERVAVLDHGKVIAEGTTGELKASVGSGALHVRLLDPAQRPEAEAVLSHVLDTPVLVESDPAALSAPVAVAEAAPSRDGAAAGRIDAAEAAPSRDGAAGLSAPVAAAEETPSRDRASPADQAARALSALAHAGVEVASFSLGQPSLDEVFLALTGRPAGPTAEATAEATAEEASADRQAAPETTEASA